MMGTQKEPAQVAGSLWLKVAGSTSLELATSGVTGRSLFVVSD
jgi:hypothetical protein